MLDGPIELCISGCGTGILKVGNYVNCQWPTLLLKCTSTLARLVRLQLD